MTRKYNRKKIIKKQKDIALTLGSARTKLVIKDYIRRVEYKKLQLKTKACTLELTTVKTRESVIYESRGGTSDFRLLTLNICWMRVKPQKNGGTFQLQEHHNYLLKPQSKRAVSPKTGSPKSGVRIEGGSPKSEVPSPKSEVGSAK